MIDIGSRAKRLPAPQQIVFDSLVEPHAPGTRPWLSLHRDEIEPRVLEAERPDRVVWSTLWPNRPDDQVRFDLATEGDETGSLLVGRSVAVEVHAPHTRLPKDDW